MLALFILLIITLFVLLYRRSNYNYRLNTISFNQINENKDNYYLKTSNPDQELDTIDTAENKEEKTSSQPQPNKLVLKKAHVPFRTILKIAFKNIWKKKVRFLVIIIITAISLGFLSFSIELNGEKLRQNVYTMINNGYRYTTIEEHYPLEEETDFYGQFNSVPLSDNSYNTLKQEMPQLTLHKYEKVEYNFAKKGIENANFFYTGTIRNIIMFDQTNDYILLAGRLPEAGTKEILITDYLVAAFKYFNIYPNCNTYYDYLNQYLDLGKMEDYKIVGIIDTPYEKWSKYMKETEINENNKGNYSFINDYEMMSSVVLNEYYFNMEKTSLPSSITFKTTGATTYKWSLSANNNVVEKTQIVTQYDTLPLKQHSWYGSFGRAPQANNEIVIPKNWAETLYNCDLDENYRSFRTYQEKVEGKSITLSITSKDGTQTYEKTFKVVGITTNTLAVQLYSEEFMNLYKSFKVVTENIILELPTSPSLAYSYFNQAFENGYVIDVWKYRADIDSYTVDPFVDIISKAGLFVFVIFTMGIMWTIMTIEIVDSKKEIGILRSIGLSGSQVSLIFVLQTLFVNICAYGLGIYLASKVIPIYNGTIKDELNIITLYMYALTYRTPIFLAIFVVIMSLISTLIPLYKITSQKIIDVINERE